MAFSPTAAGETQKTNICIYETACKCRAIVHCAGRVILRIRTNSWSYICTEEVGTNRQVLTQINHSDLLVSDLHGELVIGRADDGADTHTRENQQQQEQHAQNDKQTSPPGI